MTTTTHARLLELAARLAEVQREVERLVALARELADADEGEQDGDEMARLIFGDQPGVHDTFGTED